MLTTRHAWKEAHTERLAAAERVGFTYDRDPVDALDEAMGGLLEGRRFTPSLAPPVHIDGASRRLVARRNTPATHQHRCEWRPCYRAAGQPRRAARRKVKGARFAPKPAKAPRPAKAPAEKRPRVKSPEAIAFAAYLAEVRAWRKAQGKAVREHNANLIPRPVYAAP